MYNLTRSPPSDRFALPLRSPRRSQLPSFTSFVAPACFWLVVVWFSFVGGRLRPRRIFVVVLFLCWFAAPSEETTPPHTFRPGRLSSLMTLPPSMLTFGWLLCPSIKQRPSKAKGPSILLFLLLIKIPVQTTDNRPPHTFRPGLASSPTHPLTSTPSSIWLLFILIKWWPPKAKASPLSLLFDASYFASPSKQTNDSERNPDSLRPAHGVGERRRHDLVVPLLYPLGERGQSRWRVGWHGSSCWLLCLCVLCFAFCAPTNDQTTVPFFFRVLIFSSFVIIGVRILTRQTVIWDLFQPSARQLCLFFLGHNFFRL